MAKSKKNVAKSYTTKKEVLEALAAGDLDQSKALELLNGFEAEAKKKQIYLKVSDKGAVSLYGQRRFPTTLYKEEWLQILDMADQIREFIDEHDDELKTKGQNGNGDE